MTKRITIDPITRIEGHLRVDVEVDNGAVSNAWMGRGRSSRFGDADYVNSRPGARVVTSWTIHRLPSGSLNEQKDP